MITLDYATLQEILENLNTRIEDIAVREHALGGIPVVQYDVKADGTTNDGPALQALIDRVSTNGGGRLIIPAGKTVAVRHIDLKSNVVLSGPGTIKSISNAPNTTIGIGAGVTGWGLQDLTLVGPTVATDFVTGVFVDGAVNGRIEGCVVDGFTHFGIQLANFAEHVHVLNTHIKNIKHNPVALTGGVGLWFFRGVKHCVAHGVLVSGCEAMGLSMDAGTNDALGVPPRNNVVSSMSLYNCNTTGGEKAVEIEGAQDNLIVGLTLDGSGNQGILFNRDQASVSSDRNVFIGLQLRNIQSMPLNLLGASRNVFVGVSMSNFNLNPALAPQAIAVQSTDIYGGASSNDNSFQNVEIDGSGSASGYQYGVTLLASGSRTAARNRFLGFNWGSPLLNPWFTSSPWANVPMYGVDRNIFDLPPSRSMSVFDGGNAGSSATFSVAPEGEDLEGVITVVTGSGGGAPTGTGGFVGLFLGKRLLATPRAVLMSPLNTDTEAIKPYIRDYSYEGFTIAAAVSPAASRTYKFGYKFVA